MSRALFLDLHRLILLTTSDKLEWDNLLRTTNSIQIEDHPGRACQTSTVNFGRVLVFPGYVLFLDSNILIDRNFLLMMKDTYSARFQTLLAMFNRHDDLFKPDDWKVMEKLNFIGDKILEGGGTKSYDAIKMIEPMCNLRLTQTININLLFLNSLTLINMSTTLSLT